MRVLGFVRDSRWDRMDAVSYYRTYLPLRELDRSAVGISAQCASKEALNSVTDVELTGRDIYTMCRMYDEGYQDFIKEIHSRGGTFIIDSDDDLTETYRLVSSRGDVFKEMLAAADYVTCSTPSVAEIFAVYSQKPPIVLRNCVDSRWMQAAAAKGKRLVDGLTMGFTGSPTHWGDWYIPAVPFARIGRDFPELTLILHGEVPRYLTFAVNDASMIRLGGVPYSIYPVILKQFDVVLCAVDAQDEFNSGKSAIKALECMALGVVPICSRFQPYLDLFQQGAPIFLVSEDTRDGWYEAMRAIVQEDELRRHLSSQGPDWVYQHRDMAFSGYKQWARHYREIIN